MTKTIQLSGKRFMVSEVVEDILLRVRVPDRDRLLWIDSICIDQSNLVEKDYQVNRMRDVFAQAQTVIASLGPHRSFNSIGSSTTNHKLDGALKLVRSSWAAFGSTMKLKLSSKDERYLLELLQEPWFKRIWVVQEVAVAKRLLIVSGKKEVEGHYFAKLHRRFLPRVQDRKLRSKLEELEPLLVLMGPDLGSEAKFDLLRLLQVFRSWNSTKPHDRIYALRGLAIDCLEVPELVPNYTLPLRILYERVARYMIKRYSSLTVLTYVIRTPQPEPPMPQLEDRLLQVLETWQGKTPIQQIPTYPTWCPDWRNPYTFSNAPEPVPHQWAWTLPTPSRYRELSPRRRNSESYEDLEPLMVKGCTVGVVTSVFDGNIEASQLPAIKRKIPKWPYNKISKHLKELHTSLIESTTRQLEAEYEIKVKETAKRLEAQWQQTHSSLINPKAPLSAAWRIEAEGNVHKRKPQPQDGLMVNDQLCILQGSTGLAILRPEKANKFSLVVLDHSDYPRVNPVSFTASRQSTYVKSSVFGEIVHTLYEFSIDGDGVYRLGKRVFYGTDEFSLV